MTHDGVNFGALQYTRVENKTRFTVYADSNPHYTLAIKRNTMPVYRLVCLLHIHSVTGFHVQSRNQLGEEVSRQDREQEPTLSAL